MILASAFGFTACESNVGPEPSPAPTHPVAVPATSFADGKGLHIGFRMLYELSGLQDNGVLGVTGAVAALSAVKYGAAGKTDAALAEELGMQNMQPKQINAVALNMLRAAAKMDAGEFAAAWVLYIGNNQPILESYLQGCSQSLGLQAVFQQLDNDTGNDVVGEWAAENSLGRVKKVSFTYPEAAAPFLVSLMQADPEWQAALDTGKTRPLDFHFEDGGNNAVPTMVCYQNCGIYKGQDGAAAVLPIAGDEARLVVLVPPENMTLREFIPVAAANHDNWLAKAEWGKQRVLLPRCALAYEGSLLPVLLRAGLTGLFQAEADYGSLGEGLYFSDILHKCALVVDESGRSEPDPQATYRKGIKDDIPTLAADRPFLLSLEVTGTGQVLMMGFVRDPLSAMVK